MGSSTLKILGLFLFLVIVISITTFGLLNKTPSVTGGAGMSKEDVQAVVKDFIQNNPEAILKSVNDFQQKSQQQQDASAQKTVTDNRDALENDPSSPVAGNPKGDVTIVEFFDYSCGYCKKVMPAVIKIAEEDKNIKLVFKEFPILGPNSVLASQAALAVHIISPDKYLQFHKALMEGHTSSKESILKIATDMGLKADEISAKMDSPEVQAILAKDKELAGKVGIRGTPAFTINGEFIPGAIDYDTFKEKVKAARAAK
jgi:protein-disulfide isomerase